MASATGRESKRTGETVTAAIGATREPAPSEDDFSHEALFESMPEPLAIWRVVCDKRGKAQDLEFREDNAAFRQLFRTSMPAGRRLGDVDRQYRGDPDMLDTCLRVAATGRPETLDIHHPGPDKWFELSASPAPGSHLLTAVTEITERKRMESELLRLQYSVDHLEDYPAWSDAEGRIIETSEAACRQLGYTREELLGMTVFDICPTLDRESWAESWRSVKPPGYFRTEVRHRTKSGKDVPVEITVHAMVFDGQEYHCTFCRDVTRQKQAEAALGRLRYSLDQMDDYPTWNDATGRIIEVSESTCRHLEYTREELLKMTVFDICDDIDMEAWAKSWKKATPATPFRVEVHHRTKSGRVYPVEITVNPMVFDGQPYHCTLCRDVSERNRLEESLVATQLSVEHAPDMIHWIASDGRITYANRSMCEFLGYTLEELQALHLWEISPRLTSEVFRARWEESADSTFLAEEVLRTKDGREMSVEVSATQVPREGIALGLSFVRDITQRKQAEQVLRESEERLRQSLEAQNETLKSLREREEQLLHAQKMEAVGRLAGGIAHDFNNVLTTIIGYSDLLLSSPECPAGPVADDIGEIKAAAERAGALTKRILAFSRRQAMQPKALSLNTVVSDTERLLARTLGADIELRTCLSPGLGQVEVDEQQFVQVLLNLSVNARDAMPKGGSLTIATANVELDEQFCATHPETHPGRYVRTTVTDTGTGMDPDVVAHVFEPFYTTKPPEHGTGLGLATVYGIVAQSGGCTYVQSELGRGTTFTVYLPQVDSPAEGHQARIEPLDTYSNGHVVMVVDSDNTFLALSARILERRGCKVLPCGDAERALKALSDVSVSVDMLITDLVLSGTLQGDQLAAQAAKKRPGLPVLFMSELARDTMIETGRIDEKAAVLEKPFTAEELTRRVQTCLAEA